MGNVLYLLGLKSRYKLLTKEIIDLMNITPYNKLILQQRYVNLMEKLDIKRNSTNLWYNILTLVITLGSILVPALISIKDIPMYYSDNNVYINVSSDDSIENINNKQQHVVFWTVFVISLLVTISNAIIKLYSIDKIYIIRNLKYDELRREGWFFYTLTGNYKDFRTNNEAFKLFINNIEYIKSKLLHDELTPEFNITDNINLEYNTETHTNDASTNTNTGNNTNNTGNNTNNGDSMPRNTSTV